MNQYDGNIETATSLLSHYLKTAFKASGLTWNSDNESEIEALIEAIVAAAREH